MDTIIQNTIFRILWGLIALQSLVFAFDYPIAYTTNPVENLLFAKAKTINDESAKGILQIIDIFPENSDRDSETMDYEFFQMVPFLKVDRQFHLFEKFSHIGYKQSYFPENCSVVFNPPPEYNCFS